MLLTKSGKKTTFSNRVTQPNNGHMEDVEGNHRIYVLGSLPGFDMLKNWTSKNL